SSARSAGRRDPRRALPCRAGAEWAPRTGRRDPAHAWHRAREPYLGPSARPRARRSGRPGWPRSAARGWRGPGSGAAGAWRRGWRAGPAGGAGTPERTAAVACVREGDDARGDRRRRAATGAAGGPLRVPGVSRGPIGRRLGGREDAQLGRVGLADGDEAGLAEA